VRLRDIFEAQARLLIIVEADLYSLAVIQPGIAEHGPFQHSQDKAKSEYCQNTHIDLPLRCAMQRKSILCST
jgi:hypothetical protein